MLKGHPDLADIAGQPLIVKGVELVSERSSNIYPLAVRFVSSVLTSEKQEIAEIAI